MRTAHRRAVSGARVASVAYPLWLGRGPSRARLWLLRAWSVTSAWAQATLGANAIYAGLAYPIAVCAMTLLVGGLFIRETKDHKIDTPIRVD